ncbi:MAG: class I SAM-dependent methyltransferase [Chloroflexi bacterium]|nr:class I SAM-dependent methyltransferase [Chloroflexota bacterium]
MVGVKLMNPTSGNIFSSASSYDAYMGRWSRLVAPQFVNWLGIAPGSTWLDVGAGTGVLTQAILDEAFPAQVVGIDTSADYIDAARQQVVHDRAEFRVGDAGEISESSFFDAAVAGLVLNFVPSPEQAVTSMVKAVGAGGVVAAYVWDYTGQMQMVRNFWDAAAAVDPSSAEMEARQRYAICNPDALRSLFHGADLQAVVTSAIDVPTRFKDFDDYWLPIQGAQGSIAKYFHGIGDETRNAIRDQLQRQLPTEADGSIPLMARAWAVKGIKADPG